MRRSLSLSLIFGKCAERKGSKAGACPHGNLVGTTFNDVFPASQLHWMIADKGDCIVVECTKDGLHVYDNPAGVLTNNPPFPTQMFLLNQYMGLSEKQPEHDLREGHSSFCLQQGHGRVGDCREICPLLPVLQGLRL